MITQELREKLGILHAFGDRMEAALEYLAQENAPIADPYTFIYSANGLTITGQITKNKEAENDGTTDSSSS